MTPPNDVLSSVRERYTEGAETRVPELCCPVDYDPRYLKVLPEEILERDYGCGDPSRFVQAGDTVLDLGSGAGKICYIASQIAGPEGRVIGVDTTDEMLRLARNHSHAIGEKIGWHNVEFRRGMIQDLELDHDKLAAWVQSNPASDLDSLEALRAEEQRLRREEPLVPTGSVDLVLSNCVLNLVAPEDKQRLFSEIHRVLARGGRCAISDIVSDEDVPEELQKNPELWSGCISGALREDRFLEAFAEAGLYGIEIAAYQSEPWAVVAGIEFRSMTVVAHKGKEGPCWDHGEAVIYRGPWKSVVDDDGHIYERGQRAAVCRKTFELLQRAPYAGSFQAVPPLVAWTPEQVRPFDCAPPSGVVATPGVAATPGGPAVARRSIAETKAGVERPDVAPGADCGPGCC